MQNFETSGAEFWVQRRQKVFGGVFFFFLLRALFGDLYVVFFALFADCWVFAGLVLGFCCSFLGDFALTCYHGWCLAYIILTVYSL